MTPIAAALALPLLLAAGGGAAEMPGDVSLALADALALAKARSHELARLASLASAADAETRGARAQRLPELALSAGYTRDSNITPLVLRLPGEPPETIFPNIPDNYSAHVGLQLPLYTGGRVGSSIEAGLKKELAARSDREAGTRDLVLETTAAYWQLVQARETARVLTEAVQAFDAHAKDARAREDVGMAARNEVLLVSVERDRAELERIQASRGAEVAQAGLRRILDLPPGTRIECTEDLSVGPEDKDDAEALVSGALKARPEVLRLAAQIAVLEATAKAQASANLPQANLLAAYDYANPNARILPPTPQWKTSWGVGVTLSLTAFDGGRTASAVAQTRAEADAARHELEDLRGRIRLDVETRLLDVSTARASTEVAGRSIEAARENLRVSRERYREGVAASSDLLDAENALLRAGLDETAARTDLRIAQASLDHAAGR